MRRGLLVLLALSAFGLAILALRPELAVNAEFARLGWQADAIERSVEVSGARIVHVEAGSGPTLVLLHGYTGNKENWLALMSKLNHRFRVVAPDLPGWGDSTRNAEADYGYAAQAERLASWLPTLGNEPVVLVGHSMGGGIAAVLAARHPHLISRLVLMDAGGAPFRENEFGLAVLRGENPFAVHDRASFDRYLATVFQEPPFVPWPVDRALIARRIADADFETRVLDGVGRGPDVFLPVQESRRIATPTLLLWCAADRVIDVSAADAYRGAIAGSVVKLLKDCNHMPMMESPDDTAAALEEFLR